MEQFLILRVNSNQDLDPQTVMTINISIGFLTIDSLLLLFLFYLLFWMYRGIKIADKALLLQQLSLIFSLLFYMLYNTFVVYQ